MKLMVGFALIIGLETVASADQGPYALLGVEIQIGTTTKTGYVGVPEGELKKSTEAALAGLRKQLAFGFEEELVEVAYPLQMFVSTKGNTRTVMSADLRSLNHNPGPLDGRILNQAVIYVPKDNARLLAKAPHYQCRASWSDVPNFYYMSYNKKVGEKELEPVCTGAWNKEPDPKVERKLLANDRVFRLMIQND